MANLRYDPEYVARWFDDYGEREWDRLEATVIDRVNFEVHRRLLAEWMRAGDRVLEPGAGPGRFTLELARLGARVVVGDLSPGQLELHAERTRQIEAAVEARLELDIVDLSRFDDGSFDAVVCYGGPLSYVIDEADRAVAELLRVTRRGGHMLVSVVSLLGGARTFFGHFPELIERFGWNRAVADVFASGNLDGEINNGHVLRMYRWRDLETMLLRHPCRIVAASASNYLSIGNEELFAADPRWLNLEVAACREPGALDSGTHIVVVVERS
jgi:SAM-dependent methyltransferase